MSRRRLELRLADRGATAEARAAALETLERAGVVDDARVAGGRARSLADRGYGDAAIRAALEGEGIAEEHVAEAVASLEDEALRARSWLARRGAEPRTLRWLASKGFDPDVLADAGAFADEA
jgi:SOS response regulatory protein OraA/RecX